jgi:hypothetical protein
MQQPLLNLVDAVAWDGAEDGSKVVLKLGPLASGVVETEVWTADKQPVALLAKKNDWIAQVIPQTTASTTR